ncbi:MAG TPA: hypothetical protein VE987_10565, partial [Polyangiaceae bacterium]|nr:hypothetical protein [Polyangiaceae bacterium]
MTAVAGCVSASPSTLSDTEQRGADAAVDAARDDAFAGAIAGFPAQHAAAPRVNSYGGPVMDAPELVPVFFAGDPLQPSIEQFLSLLAASSYWQQTTGEYGVGALHVAPSVVVADPIPTSISPERIALWLSSYLDGTHSAWPPIDANKMYAVFFPQQTTISDALLGTSCQDFGAYHDEGFVPEDGDGGAGTLDAGGSDGAPLEWDAGDGGDDETGDVSDAYAAESGAVAGGAGLEAGGAALGPSFAYVVVPRCPMFDRQTGIDAVTTAASHELVEVATDPFVRTNPAYNAVDVEHLAWALASGSPSATEVGDMCVYSEPASRIFAPLVGNFVVQRTWSNQAAEASQDPCVPAAAEAYFGAAPEFDDTVAVATGGSGSSVPYLFTSGESIPVGQSRTIRVRLFSPAPVPAWAVDVSELSSTGSSSSLRFTWDRPVPDAPLNVYGQNGDSFQLTITRTGPGPGPAGETIFA